MSCGENDRQLTPGTRQCGPMLRRESFQQSGVSVWSAASTSVKVHKPQTIMSEVVSIAVFPVPRPAAGRSCALVVWLGSRFRPAARKRSSVIFLHHFLPRARMCAPNAVMLDAGSIRRSCHRHALQRLSRPISAYNALLADVRAVHFVWRGDQDNRKHSHTAPHRCNCERRNGGQQRARQPSIHRHFRP